MKTNTSKRTVDIKKTKKIDYEKGNFKKGLDVIKGKIDLTESQKSADVEKMHYTFSV